MPVLALLLLFVVLPIVEIYVIIQVGHAIGALWTVALLVADSMAGALLLKAQGRAAWRRFQQALAEGRVPAREVLDGVLVIGGGAFLLAPGFVTDVCGAALLLPPVRALLRRVLARRVTLGLVAEIPSPRFRRGGPAGGPGAGHRHGGDYDVEGTATEIDPRRLP
ncbi:MAG TPA: FxsA family protein [Baekduia sp.]|nr:FxsA family protein [Baekduia sp.]